MTYVFVTGGCWPCRPSTNCRIWQANRSTSSLTTSVVSAQVCSSSLRWSVTQCAVLSHVNSWSLVPTHFPVTLVLCLLQAPFWPSCWESSRSPWRSARRCTGSSAQMSSSRTWSSGPSKWAGAMLFMIVKYGKTSSSKSRGHSHPFLFYVFVFFLILNESKLFIFCVFNSLSLKRKDGRGLYDRERKKSTLS